MGKENRHDKSFVYVITPFRVLLLVYKPDTRGRAAPEGGGLINRNNTIKGVIKCLLPVARLRDAFAHMWPDLGARVQ